MSPLGQSTASILAALVLVCLGICDGFRVCRLHVVFSCSVVVGEAAKLLFVAEHNAEVVHERHRVGKNTLASTVS